MDRFKYRDLQQRNDYVKSFDNLFNVMEKRAEQNRNDFIVNIQSKEELRQKFFEMLGYPLTSYVPDSNISVKTDESFEMNDMICTRYQLEVMPGFYFYGILYEHKESNRHTKNAFVIAQHGGGGDPEVAGSLLRNSENYNHMVKRVVREDVSVFAPQLLLWNIAHCGGIGYDRVAIDTKLKLLGGSITGLEVYCIMKSIDYFSGVDWIDENRVGMIGLSYGGLYTLHTAAADTRIKSALSSCWFNDRLKYSNNPDWTFSNQAVTFMDAEIASLVLPRKFYIEIGIDDVSFDYKAAQQDIERLQKYAEKDNCPDSLKISIFNGVHEVDTSDVGINFLLDNL